jgi:hypothetical protein
MQTTLQHGITGVIPHDTKPGAPDGTTEGSNGVAIGTTGQVGTVEQRPPTSHTPPTPELPPPLPETDTRPPQLQSGGSRLTSTSPMMLGIGLGEALKLRTTKKPELPLDQQIKKDQAELAARGVLHTVNRFTVGNPVTGNKPWSGPGASLMDSIRSGGLQLRKIPERTEKPKLEQPKSISPSGKSEDHQYAHPRYWLDLGKEALLKGEKGLKMDKMLSKSMEQRAKELGTEGGSGMGLRCNEFAGAMALLLSEEHAGVPFEVVRMGTSTTNCHYFIALNRDGTTGPLPRDKTQWGPGVVLLDPWGCKNFPSLNGRGRNTAILTDMTAPWIVQPSAFGGELFSVCRFEGGERPRLQDGLDHSGPNMERGARSLELALPPLRPLELSVPPTVPLSHLTTLPSLDSLHPPRLDADPLHHGPSLQPLQLPSKL